MSTAPIRPSDGELAILRVLWDRGPATVRDVHGELSKIRDMGYTTVLKLMGNTGSHGMTTALMIGGVACIAIAVAGGTAQSLKTTFIIGGDPRANQVGMFVALSVASIACAGTMMMLHKAYGIGSMAIPAPQATLMKTVVEGFSRGGLFAYNWAAANPDKVSCIFGDNPVCDFKSWPGGKGKGVGSKGDWDGLIKCYNFKDEAEALAYKENPIDLLAPLAKAGIPLIHVVGDADDVVPVAENTAVIEQRYKALGGTIEVIAKPGCDHHPHSLKDPTPIVEFVLRHAPAAR